MQRVRQAADAIAIVLLLSATVAYLGLFPYDLSPWDESTHLYDAKRLMHGAVMYRDVFNFITPGWMYLMALLFWLFGTTVAVARTGVAVIHGCTVSLIYAMCRALDVRRGLAVAAALAYLVVSQPAWAYASQHWLSTMLGTAVLLLCVLHLRAPRPRSSLLLGVVLGVFVGVQQQRAALVTAGVVVWLVLDHLLERRYRVPSTVRDLAAVVLRLGLGLALVVVPLMTWLIARAGWARVWRALVVFPLFDYVNGIPSCSWGDIYLPTRYRATFTYPLLLKYLPLALLPAGLRLAWAVARGQSREQARRLLLLVVFGAASVASILYFPDFIHIAFIAPLFLVAIAESVEWALRWERAPRQLMRAAGALATAALLVLYGVRLRDNLTRRKEANKFSRMSSFGRVDFSSLYDVQLYDKLHDVLRASSARTLYCYPYISHLYLMLDVDSPAAPAFFIAGYHGPDIVQGVLDALAASPPPYIAMLSGYEKLGDPVAVWIAEHYEPIDAAPTGGWLIYRPKPGRAAA